MQDVVTNGSRVEDNVALALLQMGQGVLCQQEVCPDVDVKRGVPVLQFGVPDGGHLGPAGVANDNVEPAKLCHSLLNGRLAVLSLCQVLGKHKDLDAWQTLGKVVNRV